MIAVTLGAPALIAAALTLSATPTSGFRAELLKWLEESEKKVVALAEAVPAEKYGWRPADRVRSIGEVYLHVAGGNFVALGFLGLPIPEGMDPLKLDRTPADRARTLGLVKQSFAELRAYVSRMSDDELDRPVTLFGRPSTVREALFVVSLHQNQHLGQSIAYARMLGVRPPWTDESGTEP